MKKVVLSLCLLCLVGCSNSKQEYKEPYVTKIAGIEDVLPKENTEYKTFIGKWDIKLVKLEDKLLNLEDLAKDENRKDFNFSLEVNENSLDIYVRGVKQGTATYKQDSEHKWIDDLGAVYEIKGEYLWYNDTYILEKVG